MTTWISLLRGVNVGGRNSLPMKELRTLLEALGYQKVKTYIQSGNCVFDADELKSSVISRDVARGIEKKFGYKLSVMTLSASQLDRAINQNPYAAESSEPKSIHFFFLSEEPARADKEALQKLKHPSEKYVLTNEVFYLFAPEGIARSRLAAGAEKKIGVPATARNFRTVERLAELARQTQV